MDSDEETKTRPFQGQKGHTPSNESAQSKRPKLPLPYGVKDTSEKDKMAEDQSSGDINPVDAGLRR